MKTSRLVAAGAALVLAGSVTGASAAHAAQPAAQPSAKPTTTVVAKKLTLPLSAAQAPDGTRYWTDAAGLWKQPVGGAAALVVKSTRKQPVQAVSADGGTLRYTTGDKGERNAAGLVWTLGPTGAPVQLADTFAHEKAENPDGASDYGFLKTPKSCQAQLPKNVPPSYSGVVETHPYATAYANGTTYVADAGANDILAVSPTGAVSTVAVLEPVKVKITASAAKANKLPACTVGRKFALEAVPTDIEVGPDGTLYVTSLPGGPEDGSLGFHGRVLKISPTTGSVSTLLDGLVTPTGVAVSPTGDVYVAQLFAGVISKLSAGSSTATVFAKVPFPTVVEATPTGLLATTNAIPMGPKPKGQLITLSY